MHWAHHPIHTKNRLAAAAAAEKERKKDNNILVKELKFG